MAEARPPGAPEPKCNRPPCGRHLGGGAPASDTICRKRPTTPGRTRPEKGQEGGAAARDSNRPAGGVGFGDVFFAPPISECLLFSARFMEKIMEPTRGRRPMAVGASPPGQGAKKRPFFAPLTLPPENGPRRGEGWPRAGGRPGNSLKRKSARPPGGPSWQGAKKMSSQVLMRRQKPIPTFPFPESHLFKASQGITFFFFGQPGWWAQAPPNKNDPTKTGGDWIGRFGTRPPNLLKSSSSV